MHPYPLDVYSQKFDAYKTRSHQEGRGKIPAIFVQNRTRPRTQTDIIKMLDTEIFHKETLSPFNPLPAIGQKIDRLLEDSFNKDVCLKPLHLNVLDKRKQSAPIYNMTDENQIQKQKEVPILNEINLRNQRLNFAKKEENKCSNLLKEIKEKKMHRQNNLAVLSNTPVNVSNEKPKNIDINNNYTREKTLDIEALKTRIYNNFQKKKLLQKRERDFIPIDVNVLKGNTNFGYSDVKNVEDKCAKTQDGPAKMSDLIEMLDSLQSSRKFKEKVKRTNQWF